MKYSNVICLSLIFITLVSCGKNESKKKVKEVSVVAAAIEQTSTVVENPKNSLETDSNLSIDVTNEKDDFITNNSLAKPKKKKKNPPKVTVSAPKTKVSQPYIAKTNTGNLFAPSSHSSLKRLLSDSEMGKPIDKKTLIQEYKFPKEAVNLLKSLTKVGNNKLFFKWGSTWMVERLSDAKFKDAEATVHFQNDQLLISGEAIGIEYNKKTYNDLILKDGSAYIPTVKGYHWEIAK